GSGSAAAGAAGSAAAGAAGSAAAGALESSLVRPQAGARRSAIRSPRRRTSRTVPPRARALAPAAEVDHQAAQKRHPQRQAADRHERGLLSLGPARAALQKQAEAEGAVPDAGAEPAAVPRR